MRKQEKNNANIKNQDELEFINDVTNKDNNKQPVPQPKDYDEIEY